MSVSEQRYKAVQAVLRDGRMLSGVAGDWSVSRWTMHRWLSRYEADGFEGLGDDTHWPAHCPHQMPAVGEANGLEVRRVKPPAEYGQHHKQKDRAGADQKRTGAGMVYTRQSRGFVSGDSAHSTRIAVQLEGRSTMPSPGVRLGRRSGL
jgi:transposase-like protein